MGQPTTMGAMLSTKRKTTISITIDSTEIMRTVRWEAKMEKVKEGVVQRSNTFKAKKGKGSYTRKPKYRGYM